MTGYMGPRQLQCFGGPACGQMVRSELSPEHRSVAGRLLFFDLRTETYRATVTHHSGTYQPTLLQLGQGPLFQSRMVLKWVPPGTGEDDDDGA